MVEILNMVNAVKNNVEFHAVRVEDGRYFIDDEEFSHEEFHDIMNARKTKEEVYANR